MTLAVELIFHYNRKGKTKWDKILEFIAKLKGELKIYCCRSYGK